MNYQAKYIAIILPISVLLVSCTVFYNIPNLSDHQIFPYRSIKNAPDSIFYFANSEDTDILGKKIKTSCHYLLPNMMTLEEYIEGSKTAVFLIIRNDSILYEKYDKDYQEHTIFNVFSVTKAFITTLVGIAIDERLINSVDDPITTYIPELRNTEGFDEITIHHLLSHTSGIESKGSLSSPFSDNTKYYYGRKLRKLALKSSINVPPGTQTFYNSANTQLLAMALESATGMTVSSYLQEKIWKKIGMEYNATWSLDNKRDNSIEKGFSNLNCRAIDLAKLGRLYLNDGTWNHQQVLSKTFIEEATKRDTTEGSCWNFQYSFKLGPKEYESYYTKGLYGQLIYTYPKSNLIIVRIGEADLNYNPQFIDQVILQIIDQLNHKSESMKSPVNKNIYTLINQ